MRYDSPMIRTRNFLLFILMLAFLVGGILLTLWFSASSSTQSGYTDMIFGGAETATMTAVVETPEDKRESRLASLRAKLAQYTDVALAPSTAEVAVETNTDMTGEAIATSTTVASADLCSNYSAVSLPVLSGQLTYAVSGGQRTFGKTETIPATSSTTLPTVTMATVFALPLRSVAVGFTSCIASNIVAVTPTGAPISNTDAGTYRASGEATLIGYTIDGFELYGNTSSLPTDSCGGATVSGTYRYYLSSERDTILNCFAAIPVAL